MGNDGYRDQKSPLLSQYGSNVLEMLRKNDYVIISSGVFLFFFLNRDERVRSGPLKDNFEVGLRETLTGPQS